ncbi:glutathione S-transferase 1-like [Artemia franciscana]|uniref:glutathione transferase n=1 Tax=Artemia franciscana TaxID=6661 RepID=A0AA88LCJ5_ARTSF|nr:hypothetical protein QYM36_010837 [Artemia franciscana]
MAEYKLYYFNERGRAEPIRLIFAYTGVKYEDIRTTKEEFRSKDSAIKAKTPTGYLPLLEVNGRFLPQTLAIIRYLAKAHGLQPEDPFDSAIADAYADTVSDLVTASLPARRETDPTKKKELGLQVLQEKLLPAMAVYEKRLSDNRQYLIGNKISWIDFVVFAFLDELHGKFGEKLFETAPNAKAYKERMANLPGVKEWIESRPNTEK